VGSPKLNHPLDWPGERAVPSPAGLAHLREGVQLVDVRTHRLKLLTGLGAAACLVLTTIGPGFAQSAVPMGSWLAGPDGVGTSTIIGRVEAPRARQNINPASSVLVTGWAADTTASGWTGIDGVEVWSGAKDKGGSKLASGSVGLARADIAEALGNSFLNSGFSAVIPGSAWASMKGGALSLFVYLHTPGKGTWYRSLGVNLLAGLSLPFPNDPVVWFAKPQDGMFITQKQVNNKITFSGIALDRNPLTSVQGSLALLPPGFGQTMGTGCSACSSSTGGKGTQDRGAGIQAITAYIDNPPAKGDNTTFGNFGAPCVGCAQGVVILVSNKGVIHVAGKPEGSIVTRNYGSDFDFSGWAISINPALLSPGPHTMFVTAQSAITGKSSTAQVTFNIIGFVPNQRIQP
jgi:hypothetical protein